MRDWLKIVKEEFKHPAILIWRAIEMRSVEKAIQKYAPREPILDIGCAEGKINSIVFAEKRVFGLDNCWELLSQNKLMGKRLVLADGCFMPFKEGTFETIFSNCVIEHIPDLNKLLEEAGRVLKQGGELIFTVPSHKFPRYLMLPFKSYGQFRMRWLNCYHCYAPQEWEARLKQKGFKMVDYSYYMSRHATLLWDFLAGLMFIFRSVRLNNLDNFISNLFMPVFYRLYASDNGKDGSGLLIVARKA